MSTISEDEKRTLVASILAHPIFAKAGQSSDVLAFLFKWHLENPATGPTQSILYEGIHGRTPSTYEERTLARKQVERLRALLAKYFSEVGLREPLVLTIPTGGVGGYQLLFERRSDRFPFVVDWFWGTYMDVVSDTKSAQFFYAPTKSKGEPRKTVQDVPLRDTYAVLEAYRHLSSLLGPKRLEVSAYPWEKNKCDTWSHTIYIVNDHRFAEARPVGIFQPVAVRGEISWAASDHFRISMLDRSDQAVFINLDEGSPPFKDSSETEFVLLTRFTLEAYLSEHTILCSKSLRAVAKVAEYLTCLAGLQNIEAAPKLREATTTLRNLWKSREGKKGGTGPTSVHYKGRAPFEFQILFAVSTTDRNRLDAEGRLSDVKIQAVSVPPFEVKIEMRAGANPTSTTF